MAIYSCWIFDRHCNCVYSREWEPKVASGASKLFAPFTASSTSTNKTATTGSSTPSLPAKSPKNQHSNGRLNITNQDDKAKLLFGAIFSLRNIASKLYPNEDVKGMDPNDVSINPFPVTNLLTTFSTSHYRVHYFETASNWKFALISDPKLEDMRSVLEYIYTVLFNEYVAKNGLSQVDFNEGEYINNHAFVTGLDEYVTSLPGFAS